MFLNGLVFEWLCFWPTLIGKLGRASAVTVWQKVWGLIYVLRFWAWIQNQSTVLQLWTGHFQAQKVANNLVLKKKWFACNLSAASTGVEAGCMWTDRLMCRIDPLLSWESDRVPPGCEVGVGLLCDDFLSQKRVKKIAVLTFYQKKSKAKNIVDTGCPSFAFFWWPFSL